MNYNLKLTNNDGFQWSESHGIHLKGYCYINGKYSDEEEVLAYFSDINSKNEFFKLLNQVNGCFSIVAEIDGNLIAISDMMRSFPLYYAEKNGALYIRDEATEIINVTGFKKINHTALIDYLHFECVMYNDTLVNGINQISAMHYIYLEKGKETPEIGKYMTIYNAEYSIKDKSTAEKKLDSVFKDASVRLVASLKGRTAAVSLSGGVDSRACLMMLKSAGYNNVICYTYGVTKSPDTEVAEKVAGLMGYKYVFIPNDRKLWKKAYKDEYTLTFIKKSHNLSAISHMESHFIIRRLLKEKIVPDDSVFFTGHVGVMAKSHFEEDREYTKEELVETYWKYYGKLYSLRGKRKKHYFERLSGYIGHKESYSRLDAETAYENAGYGMCRSKHLINSHRQFEINGCEWRLPLMDYEIMSAFNSMDPSVRDEKKKFFTEYIINRTGCEIREAVFSKSIFTKVIKNLRNPVYSIMRPWKFLTLGYKACLLPVFPIRQYRFMRRFYSYCALQEIKLIKEWYDLRD